MRIWAVALFVALAGCAAKGGWVKDGMTGATLKQDHSLCRQEARVATERDRRIDDDIRSAGIGRDHRGGGLDRLRGDVRQLGAERRYSDVVSGCMRGLGYVQGSEGR